MGLPHKFISSQEWSLFCLQCHLVAFHSQQIFFPAWSLRSRPLTLPQLHLCKTGNTFRCRSDSFYSTWTRCRVHLKEPLSLLILKRQLLAHPLQCRHELTAAHSQPQAPHLTQFCYFHSICSYLPHCPQSYPWSLGPASSELLLRLMFDLFPGIWDVLNDSLNGESFAEGFQVTFPRSTREIICGSHDLWGALRIYFSMQKTGSIPGSARSSGRWNGNPLEYSCLGNPMDRGAWWLQWVGLQRIRHTEHAAAALWNVTLK